MYGKKIAQKMFIFAQFLEKIAQILEKFTQFSKVAQYMQSSLGYVFSTCDWEDSEG